MKRMMILFILYALLFAVTGCGRKAQQEETAVPVEEGGVAVSMPAVAWSKSIALETGPGLSSGDLQATETFQRLVGGELGRDPRIKVLMNPAEGEEPEHRVLGKVMRDEGTFRYEYRIEDQKGGKSGGGVLVGSDSSFLLLTGQAVRQVSQSLDIRPETDRDWMTAKRSDLVDAFLKSERLISQRSYAAANQAVAELKSILRQDSTFLPAHAGLAESYLQILENGWNRNPVWMELARLSCIKALSMDPDFAHAHMLQGRVRLLQGEWKSAEKDFRKALALNSSLAGAWTGLGSVMAHYGLYESALAALNRGLALDEKNLEAGRSRAMILIGLADYTGAEKQVRRLLALFPQASSLHSFLALALFYRSDWSAAEKEIQAGLADPDYRAFSHAVYGMILAGQDRPDEALSELLEATTAAHGNPSLNVAIAAVHALLGRKGESISWLEKAVDGGYMEYPWIVRDPNFKSLQGDGRFQALLEGLKARWEERKKSYS
ncbi:tetratricopeptide repeat protein [bacterium]|nr:tetratricopeptide repeat protein [bacterium]